MIRCSGTASCLTDDSDGSEGELHTVVSTEEEVYLHRRSGCEEVEAVSIACRFSSGDGRNRVFASDDQCEPGRLFSSKIRILSDLSLFCCSALNMSLNLY